MLVLDVPTRENSTYLMLEVAEKFEKVFSHLEYEDNSSFLNALDSEGGAPSIDDWNHARVFIKFLKIFYDATLSFSGSLHVIENTFFHKLCEIQDTLMGWQSDDHVLQRMAISMKSKFDKYWDVNGINYLLLVAVFLDPRFKWEYIEFCFIEMYSHEKSKSILKKLKDIIKSLFSQYMSLNPLPPDTHASSGLSSDVASQSQVESNDDGNSANLFDKFILKVKKKRGELKRNEFDKYMEDDVEDNYEGFDILR